MFEVEDVRVEAPSEKLTDKAKVYQSIFSPHGLSNTLTFNDVLMVPQYSEVSSR
jgi:hypothetical protein